MTMVVAAVFAYFERLQNWSINLSRRDGTHGPGGVQVHRQQNSRSRGTHFVCSSLVSHPSSVTSPAQHNIEYFCSIRFPDTPISQQCAACFRCCPCLALLLCAILPSNTGIIHSVSRPTQAVRAGSDRQPRVQSTKVQGTRHHALATFHGVFGREAGGSTATAVPPAAGDAQTRHVRGRAVVARGHGYGTVLL